MAERMEVERRRSRESETRMSGRRVLMILWDGERAEKDQYKLF